jgi:hypothetical protein
LKNLFTESFRLRAARSAKFLPCGSQSPSANAAAG